MRTNAIPSRDGGAAAPTQSRYQYLTDTNRGTPAGELLRRYWHPIALEADLPQGGAPLGARIMGEDLVLFHDNRGRVGALDRKCTHRCADLVLGRIEEGGIRCPYHGWLFDADGRVLDQPAEPSATAKERIRAKSYPVHRAGGAFWVYIGPGEPPLFPNYPALQGSDEHRYTCRWFGDCNWLQASEGNIDPIHTSYLHQIELGSEDMKARWGVFANSERPQLSIAETRFGVRLFTTRPTPNGETSLRVTNFVMPNACAVGGFEGNLGNGGLTMLWDVPIDNERHFRWEFIYHRSGKLDKETLDKQYRTEKVDGTDRMRRSRADNYGQDRASMGAGFYIGLGACFSIHDVVITQSQGQIHNQAGEHLSSSDIAIVRARRMLDEAAKMVAEGRDPPGVIRNVEENDFRDMVVVTETLGAGDTKEALVGRVAADPGFFAAQGV
jgi:phenylpropionate dioxygenase-like ring-hydroxylating dioxygenase large terminal subunit